MPDQHLPQSGLTNRRQFVSASVGFAAGLTALQPATAAFAQSTGKAATKRQPLIRPGDVVLFQGDSITSLDRQPEHASEPSSQPGLGSGYAFLAASQILMEHPDNPPKFYNRGAGGNKLLEMIDRWQVDCLDLKPDLLSILIGVNDFWHTYLKEYNGSLEQYTRDYRALLKRTKEKLPNLRLIICEPFISKLGPVQDDWFPAFVPYREATKQIAAEAGAVFIPYQSMFTAAEKIAPVQQWSQDGCHPTASGTALMAIWWLNAVS